MISKLGLVICIFAVSAWPSLASQESSSAALNVYWEDGSLQHYQAFPGAMIHSLFPSGEAQVDRELAPAWQFPSTALRKQLRLVTLTDPCRRFAITGVIYRDRLFLFDEIWCGENADILTELMRAASISPKSPDEALSLAKFYLSLSSYDLEDSSKFIVTNLTELPKTLIPDPQLEDMRNVFRPPPVTTCKLLACRTAPQHFELTLTTDSQPKADKRVEDFLQDAVAVLENGPWLDSSGKAAGAL
jgi:hypothetical protein